MIVNNKQYESKLKAARGACSLCDKLDNCKYDVCAHCDNNSDNILQSMIQAARFYSKDINNLIDYIIDYFDTNYKYDINKTIGLFDNINLNDKSDDYKNINRIKKEYKANSDKIDFTGLNIQIRQKDNYSDIDKAKIAIRAALLSLINSGDNLYINCADLFNNDLLTISMDYIIDYTPVKKAVKSDNDKIQLSDKINKLNNSIELLKAKQKKHYTDKKAIAIIKLSDRLSDLQYKYNDITSKIDNLQFNYRQLKNSSLSDNDNLWIEKQLTNMEIKIAKLEKQLTA